MVEVFGLGGKSRQNPFPHPVVLLFHLPLFQVAADGRHETKRVERLGQVVVGSFVEEIDGRSHIVGRRKENHLRGGLDLEDDGQELRTRYKRHAQIQDNDRIGLGFEHGGNLAAVGAFLDVVEPFGFQNEANGRQLKLVVVNEEDRLSPGTKCLRNSSPLKQIISDRSWGVKNFVAPKSILEILSAEAILFSFE